MRFLFRPIVKQGVHYCLLMTIISKPLAFTFVFSFSFSLSFPIVLLARDVWRPKFTSEQKKSLSNLPIFLVTYWILPRITSLTTNNMAPKSNANPSTSYGWPHFILLLQEVTWQSWSFLPAGWLKGLCILWSRQQLNNRYWVAYKSFICCDQVQLEFEPWTDEDNMSKYIFK